MDLVSRARIAKNLPRIMEWQKRAQEAKSTGQNDLFGGGAAEVPPLELEETEPWSEMEALEEERQAVGFYLSGHPLDWLQPWLDMADAIRENNEKYGLNKPEKRAKRNVYRPR